MQVTSEVTGGGRGVSREEPHVHAENQGLNPAPCTLTLQDSGLRVWVSDFGELGALFEGACTCRKLRSRLPPFLNPELSVQSQLSEAGTYLRLKDSWITQRTAQGPARTCNESKEEQVKTFNTAVTSFEMSSYRPPLPTRG